MGLERQIWRVFGLKKSAQSAMRDASLGDEGSLMYLGYPLLHQVDFFLTTPALARWRTERNLLFPSRCCICMESAHHLLPAYNTRWLGFRGGHALAWVPHCESHGNRDEACLLVRIDSWNEFVCRFMLIGLNEAFLRETARLNEIGAVPAPWQAFAGYSPHTGGWRQGNGEYWMQRVWRPYWSHLSVQERADYLARWPPPPEWVGGLDLV